MRNNKGKADFNLSPFIVIWEVTQSCDLACVHCRADARCWRDPAELTTEEGFRLIDDITEFDSPMGSPLLVLTGGDPLKRPDIFELIKHAVGKGVRTTISPSITPLVTSKALIKFKESGVSRIAISLDGSTPDIHDAFRGVPGSFKRTADAILVCTEEGIPLQINTTVTKHNFDDLRNIAHLIEGFNPVLWSVFFLVPTGRGKIEDEVSPEEYEYAFDTMSWVSETMSYDVKSTEAPHYRRFVLQQMAARSRERGRAANPARDKIHDVIGRAPAGINDGKGFVFISHTGDVMPSGFLPISGGNVREKSIVEIYRESPLFKEIRDYSKLKGKCGACEFKHVCGGSRARSYALTGDYLESEPYCVYIPKGYDAEVPDFRGAYAVDA